MAAKCRFTRFGNSFFINSGFSVSLFLLSLPRVLFPTQPMWLAFDDSFSFSLFLLYIFFFLFFLTLFPCFTMFELTCDSANESRRKADKNILLAFGSGKQKNQTHRDAHRIVLFPRKKRKKSVLFNSSLLGVGVLARTRTIWAGNSHQATLIFFFVHVMNTSILSVGKEKITARWRPPSLVSLPRTFLFG